MSLKIAPRVLEADTKEDGADDSRGVKHHGDVEFVLDQSDGMEVGGQLSYGTRVPRAICRRALT